ncbi:MAG: hypothetical protein JST00_28000 [Deltaproteobacteria bacterium]|nr:hypothetical protein [Deltaproteobacteria bacterium]
MSEATRTRLGLSLVATCTTALALYGLVRIAQKIVFPEPDPALVIWSEHAGFFWRAWTVTYLGGMVGLATWMVSDRHPARVARALARALPLATALLALQGLLVP